MPAPGWASPWVRRAVASLVLATAVLAAGCAGRGRVESAGPGYKQRGVASWYGPGFDGRKTANGETYDMMKMTAAHKQLPFGTVVEVRNRDNGRRTEVRINDRGPFVRGRIIDLSRAAADAIGMLAPGTARVEIRVLRPGEFRQTAALEDPRSWLVQAGAFEDRGGAEALRSEIRALFPDARVTSGEGWHRVVMGPFRKRKEAEKRAAELRRRGFSALVRSAESATS